LSGRFDEAPLRHFAKSQIYLDFFFFFFFDMIFILGVCDEPTAGLVQSQADLGLDLGPWVLAPLPSGTMP
jgi:hypothetical protein